LVAAGKPKLVAIGATMRKLVVIIYTMLKKQQPFQAQKFLSSCNASEFLSAFARARL